MRNFITLYLRPAGTPRRRREDNIKMDLTEIGWGGMDWIHLAEKFLSS
jgi:hypothetical protein